MAYDLLLIEKEGPIALLTLNRPDKRNALSVALRDEIVACLKYLEQDEEIRAVIITGSGPAFSAGFDLGEAANRDPDFVARNVQSSDRYHTKLASFRKPIIAAINGPALGGGLDLAALCDIRIASETAFFAHPEIKFGAMVMYDALKEVIGGGRARELCLTGRRVDAAEALSIGLVSRVVPGNKLIDEAKTVAYSVAEAPMAALISVKDRITALSDARHDDIMREKRDPFAGADPSQGRFPNARGEENK